MKYVIAGDPVPLARCRFGNGRVWDAQKQIKYRCGLELIAQHKNQPKYTGPLAMDIVFFMAVPKTSLSKRGDSKLFSQFHSSRPDMDNCLKFLLDIGNGILYADDSSVAVITCKKVYDKNPRIEFIITELKGS